ncbi:MAG: ketoacyl-ACP synthase III [Oscillospiraceae bacterium]|nr:ketoacyl-ACP synthase III [Oscillospiraceae bacterium]
MPDFVLDNFMFDQTVETSDDWIISRTGIKERRMEQEKYNFQMIGEACCCALENAKILPSEIDHIIVSTITPDFIFPSTACLVQNYINALNAASFDISAACAGFVFALDLADSYIKSGKAKNMLIASGDVLTRTVDYYDRGNCILFGDGAGAAVVSACESDEGFGVLSTYVNCECDGEKPYFIKSRLYEPGQIYNKATKQFMGNATKVQDSYISQNGRAVLEFVSRIVPKSLDEVSARANIDVSDLKYIIMHQANRRILYHVIEKYGLNPEKVPMSIEKYGNTSSSTVPILLHELVSEGKINKGDLIAFLGFGSGLSYGAAVIRW